MKTELKSTLEELEKTAEEFWNISRQTGNFMNMLIKASDAKKVLEIGTSNGYSALWLASALKNTNGHLTTIEFWEKRQCLAKKYIENCGLSDYVTFKTGRACDIIKNEIKEIFDLIFMDANKQEYLSYFEAVHPILRKGGIILADNITSHYKKAEPFVEAISNNPGYQAQILDLPDGLLMAYKL